jgi:carbon storage regulator
MLNFTVKPGECFQIGDEITVVVLGGTKNNIKVMVEAPRRYNIVRGKILERIEKEAEDGQGRSFTPEPELPKELIYQMIAQQKKQKSAAQ